MLGGSFFAYFCLYMILLLSSLVASPEAVPFALFFHSHSGDEYVLCNVLQYSRLFFPWNNLAGDIAIPVLQFKLRIVPQTILYVFQGWCL